MALIICSECGSRISDKAAMCVKCGCPLRNASMRQAISEDNPLLIKKPNRPPAHNHSSNRTYDYNSRVATPKNTSSVKTIIMVTCVFIIIGVFILAYILDSRNNNNSGVAGNNNSLSSQILGSWELQNDSNLTRVLTFNDNGQITRTDFLAGSNQGSDILSYSIDGNTLTYVSTRGGHSFVYTYEVSINDNQMILTGSDRTEIYTRYNTTWRGN